MILRANATCSQQPSHFTVQGVCLMNEQELEREALEIADNKLREIADEIADDLTAYAKAHKRTGMLARTIHVEKTDKGYLVSGGTRADYSNNSYHAITFFKFAPAQAELQTALNKARGQIKLR